MRAVTCESAKSNLIVLLPTYSRLEKYADDFLELLRINWPDFPETFVVTDCGKFRFGAKIVIKEVNWVSLLLAGIRKLKGQGRMPAHVILMLDDLVPLTAVNNLSVVRGFETMRARGWAKLSFFNDGPEPYQLEEVEQGTERYFRIPTKAEQGENVHYPWVNALQVAIWDCAYLETMCEKGIRLGVTDAWGFEHLDGDSNHYVSSYHWPTAFHGLSHRGALNFHAIRAIGEEAVCIRRRLWISFWKGLPLLLKRRFHEGVIRRFRLAKLLVSKTGKNGG